MNIVKPDQGTKVLLKIDIETPPRWPKMMPEEPKKGSPKGQKESWETLNGGQGPKVSFTTGASTGLQDASKKVAQGCKGKQEETEL